MRVKIEGVYVETSNITYINDEAIHFTGGSFYNSGLSSDEVEEIIEAANCKPKYDDHGIGPHSTRRELDEFVILQSVAGYSTRQIVRQMKQAGIVSGYSQPTVARIVKKRTIASRTVKERSADELA